MKNVITEMKNSLEGFNIRLDQQKRESANSTVHLEIIQSKKQHEKG